MPKLVKVISLTMGPRSKIRETNSSFVFCFNGWVDGGIGGGKVKEKIKEIK